MQERPTSGPVTTAAAGMRSSLDMTAVAILVMMTVFLALGQIAMKVANTGISPLWQAGLRSLAGGLLLGAFAALRGIGLGTSRDTFWPTLLASTFFAAEFGLLYPGLERTTVAHAVILLYTSPFVVAIGAHYLIPGDRLTAAKVAGLLLAFTGVAVVVLLRETSAAPGVALPTLTGDLLCLAAAFAWGFLTLVIRSTTLAKLPAERVTFHLLAFSCPMLLGLSRLIGEPGITNPSSTVLGAFAFTVVFVAFIVFTTTNWLLTRYPASKVMAFLLLTPILGVGLGHVMLGEAVGPGLLAGLALVVAGLWLVNRPPAK